MKQDNARNRRVWHKLHLAVGDAYSTRQCYEIVSIKQAVPLTPLRKE
ncbi:hypothetical protein [Candidatus Enterovibrio altilux]